MSLSPCLFFSFLFTTFSKKFPVIEKQLLISSCIVGTAGVSLFFHLSEALRKPQEQLLGWHRITDEGDQWLAAQQTETAELSYETWVSPYLGFKGNRKSEKDNEIGWH